MIIRAALAFCLIFCFAFTAAAGEPAARHGLSIFGDLKYGPGFQHFDYVDPDAPKGGEFRSWQVETFDSLNPFIVKGTAPGKFTDMFGVDQTFASLMAASADEADAVYAYVAASAEQDPAGLWVAFDIRPEARFHDGSPITADDVIFSYETLKRDGEPDFRIRLAGVAAATADTPHRVRFTFTPGAARDLPVLVASLPIFSKAATASRKFDQTTLEPLLGSGPYKVDKVDPGRSITYRRVADWWGKDLPVSRGRFNYDSIRYDFYRDRDIALEAFFGGQYNFREEFTSRAWATAYDRPAVRDGRIVKLELAQQSPPARQSYYWNLRRAKFADRRVRAALEYAYDFEWTNKNLFFGLYEREHSVFGNSDMAASGPPGPAELALLQPLRDKLPPEVFGPAYLPPKTDGSGNLREHLKIAAELLKDAGWQIRDGKLTSVKTGEPFRIEFLEYEPNSERIDGPYTQNLKRLGIDCSIRMMDSSAYQNRIRDYDFDVIGRAYGVPLTPGLEERVFWGSASADQPGSLNYAGIKDPAVDALVEAMVKAKDRPTLNAAARALDRVITWNHYIMLELSNDTHKVAFWNEFGRPKLGPRYALGVVDTWWIDAAKSAALKRGAGN